MTAKHSGMGKIIGCFKPFQDSLRIRIASGLTPPLLLAMSCLSLIHHHRERQLVEIQIQSATPAEIDRLLHRDLGTDMILTVISTLVISFGLYLLIHWLVVKRIESFRQPLADFAAGNFCSRLLTTSPPKGELDRLAIAFNQMADELERHAREQEERSELRLQAIVEERERIARELHDGFAQFLGYVSTDVYAVRLMLQGGKIETAEQHLFRLGNEACRLLVDVRQAIVGLRMAGQAGDGLVVTLQELGARFSQLTNLPVEVAAAPNVDTANLLAESELQLACIVQEALSNVRKHARANRAWISLCQDGDRLELTVSDDGIGFDARRVLFERGSHFGLSTMRERAEAIGAGFAISTSPGTGTCITVDLTMTDDGRPSDGAARSVHKTQGQLVAGEG